MSFATGLITNTIPCWLISVKNRSPSSENVMCLATQQSRDLVLANHRMTNTPINLQDLRRSLYVKAKAEPSWRFWGL
jgi:hypothetical protein